MKDNQTRFGKGSEEKEDGVLCSSLSAFEFITHLIKTSHSQGQTGGGSRLTKLLCFFPSIIRGALLLKTGKCGKFPTWHLDKFIHMTYFISSITNLNIHIHTHLYINTFIYSYMMYSITSISISCTRSLDSTSVIIIKASCISCISCLYHGNGGLYCMNSKYCEYLY